MARGPLGGRRPFVSQNCQLVFGYYYIGLPRNDVEQKLTNLKLDLARNTRIPAKERDIFIERGKRSNNANTATILIGMDSGAGISEMSKWDDRIQRKADKVLSDLQLQKVVAGDVTQFAAGTENIFTFGR